jgi:hypothetical protein
MQEQRSDTSALAPKTDFVDDELGVDALNALVSRRSPRI